MAAEEPRVCNRPPSKPTAVAPREENLLGDIMNDPDAARLEEEREEALRPGPLGDRPYLVIALVVFGFLGVAFLGVTGPRPDSDISPQGPTANLTQAASGGPGLSAEASGGAGSVRTPRAFLTPNPAYVPGLINLHVNQADVASMDIGSNVVPMAAYQDRLLVSTGAELFLVDPARSRGFETVARASQCGRVTQAAMNAKSAIFLEIAPAGSPRNGSAACPRWGGEVDWTVTIVDLTYGTTRQVATGSMASSEAAWAQPAGLGVAMADQAYALAEPDPVTGLATVLVRRQADDGVLYVGGPIAGLTQLYLADTRLAVVADHGSPAGSDRKEVLETISWSAPLQMVGYTTGAVSLSQSGDRLAFASCDSKPACETITLIGGSPPLELALPLGAGSLAVDSGSLGTVAWASQTSPEYPTSYVGLWNSRWPMLVALIGIAPPDWIYVKSDVLLMVSVSAEGIVRLSEVDLVSAHVSE